MLNVPHCLQRCRVLSVSTLCVRRLPGEIPNLGKFYTVHFAIVLVLFPFPVEKRIDPRKYLIHTFLYLSILKINNYEENYEIQLHGIKIYLFFTCYAIVFTDQIITPLGLGLYQV